SVVSNTPPDESPRYMWFASRGSMLIEWSIDPSGVFSSGHSHHVSHIGWSFQPSTVDHVSPLSSVRNSPCGEPPAYQTPGSEACPGVSQNTRRTLRSRRSPV